MDQLTCTDCGIRFSGELTSCPWCGADAPAALPTVEESPQPVVVAEPIPENPGPSDPTDPTADADDWGLPGGQDETDPLKADFPNDSEAQDQAPAGDWQPIAADPAPESAADETPVDTASDETAPDETGPAEALPLAAGPAVADDEWDSGDEWDSTVAMPAVTEPAEERPAPRFETPAAKAAQDGSPPKKPWKWKGTFVNAGLIAALLASGAAIAEFAPIGGTSDDAEPIVAATVDPGVTVVVETTVAATTMPATTVTTVPPTTVPPTTVPPTTLPATTTIPPIDPVGDPIAIADLTMGVDRIGELIAGSDGANVIGRLVASLGQPNDDTGIVTSEGELGTCAGQRIRAVRFGSLTIVNLVETGGAEVFASYRLLEDPDGAAHPSDDMATISGISIGDSVGNLKITYSNLDVSLIQVGGETFFELKNSSGSLLLHGPVSSPADQGIIQGIYSPDACTA